MGGCVSFQISCDQVLSRVGSCICGKDNYICNLKKNLEALQEAIVELKARQNRVLRRVQTEERNGLQRLQEVQVWLTKVDTIVNQFDDLDSTITAELQKLCLYGVCSKDINSRFRYGKRVFLMLQEVRKLRSRGVFEVVAESPVRDVAEERPLQTIIVGQETMLEKAWNSLMDDGTQIMGLYGMGGVGKTTLLEQINNKFRGASNVVDMVIWVVVSKEKRVEKIQDEIAEKLGLSGNAWNQKTINQKATGIHHSLRNKRFVLLLDDIWSKVDLKEIGVPFPKRENKCKIVFSTRSREVCGRMGVDDPMEVRCLSPNEAWELFQNKVGQNTLQSHPDIPDLASKVAEKCRGLPLALNVIGETMACKRTVEEWCNAIDILSSYAADFSGMEDEVLSILKYSYDNLKGEQVKSCFLYCALFPEDFIIDKSMLIDYWIGEGFIDEKQGIQKAVNQGHEIIGTLRRACLLEEGRDVSNVKMHDVIREMALWISSDLGKHKETCIVQAGVGLSEIPKVKNWGEVRRISLMENEIGGINGSSECLVLETLLLRKNPKLVNISGDFFGSMPRLVVLDLSWNDRLVGLPEQISALVSLRYLNLSRTKIESLPAGLQELKKLIHLNLEWALNLKSITGISNLLSLRILKLRFSTVSFDLMLMNELQSLEHLEVLTTEIKSSSVFEKLLYSHRMMKCIQEVDFRCLQDKVLTLPAMECVRAIQILSCWMREIEIMKVASSTNRRPAISVFVSLSSVHISNCSSVKHLSWLLFAPNLISLDVSFSDELEDIISEDKAVSSVREEEAGVILPFHKLEKLELYDLPKLNSIYWNALLFPSLKEFKIDECPNLSKLPFDSKSVGKIEELVISYKVKEWTESIIWEDEATKQRFLPYFKLE